MGRMGRTAVLSGNWYAFYWRTAMCVLIISRAVPPPSRLRLCVPTTSTPAWSTSSSRSVRAWRGHRTYEPLVGHPHRPGAGLSFALKEFSEVRKASVLLYGGISYVRTERRLPFCVHKSPVAQKYRTSTEKTRKHSSGFIADSSARANVGPYERKEEKKLCLMFLASQLTCSRTHL